MATAAQNHLHLDTALGGAPENSPVLYFSALTGPREIRSPESHTAVEWAVDATALFHQVTSAGSALTSEQRTYRVRLTRANVVSLLTLVGEYCYFVPPYHPDDGSNHAASVVQVYFIKIRDLVNEKSDLLYFQATIVLQYTAS